MQTLFEKSHPRNIPVNFFQNLTILKAPVEYIVLRRDKKEKNCKINVFGRTSEIQYFYQRWILNIIGQFL